MTIRLLGDHASKVFDGEWEFHSSSEVTEVLKTEGVHDFCILKRIQPKEKSLFETLLDARLRAETENGADNASFHLLCFTIEALEKRVEEQERKMSAVERACEYWDDDQLLKELKK